MNGRELAVLRATACACAVLAAACGDEAVELTQIVVVIDSDMTVPAELDELRLEVNGTTREVAAMAALGDEGFPRSIGLLHAGGPLGPIHVQVIGMRAGRSQVERSAEVSFVRGETVELRIGLLHECAGVTCRTGETCGEQGCGLEAIADLPAFGGTVSDGFVTLGGGAGSGPAAGDPGSGAGGTTAPPMDTTTPPADVGNSAPVCAISSPGADRIFRQGDSIELRGLCTDAESGTLGSGQRWQSDRDGGIGGGPVVQVSDLSVGVHTLMLCATDPRDPALRACASVRITVEALPPPPTVTIDGMAQGATTTSPFSSDAPLDLHASATGEAISFEWTDNLLGALSSTETASLDLPLVGKHVVDVVVTDSLGRTATDGATFVVLAPGQSQLVADFATANADLGSVSSLWVDSAGRALANTNAKELYTFDSAAMSGGATLVLDSDQLPAPVNDIFVSETAGIAYFATSAGLTVCSYTPVDGVVAATCATFAGDDFPSDAVTAVVRLSGSDGAAYTITGTEAGVLVLDNAAGASTGTDFLGDRRVYGLAVANNLVWIATDDGLFRYDPVTHDLDVWRQDDGAPSDRISAVAVGSGGDIWVGSDRGLGRYDPSRDRWTTWRMGQPPLPGLPSNRINAIAIGRATIAGLARDVVWAGSDQGVTRFDPTIPSMVTLDSTDGLPGNDVRTIAIAPDGTKVIGTTAGVATYAGP